MIEVTKPRAIALGYFDGVHLGHRALMQRAVERAKQIGGTSAVFTFDVHPDSVVMGRQVPLLTANAYRTEEIKKLGGVDEVIFGHFDHEIAAHGLARFYPQAAHRSLQCGLDYLGTQ